MQTSSPYLPTPPAAHEPSLEADAHVVQLYSDDNFLLDLLSRFIGGALAGGDAAVVVATNSHRSALEARLSAHGLDLVQAARQRRYAVLDATEALPQFMVNGAVDDRRFLELITQVLAEVQAADGKPRRVAVFGELVALLWAQGKPQEAIRIEQLWNRLAKSCSMSLLCAYPMTGFRDEKHIEPFLTMCGQHSAVVPSESYLGLSSEAERLRAIAELEQKAHVLGKELVFRQSEERFRLLVEAVRDYAIFMLDPQGHVGSWNVGAERIKGYRAGEILGRHFSCFYPEEDVQSGKPERELITAVKEGRFEDEGWRLRKDGSRFWANVIITPMREDSGKLVGFAKVTRDFTERVRAETALQREVSERQDAQSRLHNSERSLRQLSLHLLRLQDEERRRIGRDLHDSLGQYLAVLKMKLDSVAGLLLQQNGEVAEDIAQCLRLTEDSIREVRTVSYLLYPPMLEEMGLKSAIPWYLEGFSARSGVQTSFEAQKELGRLPRERELALFRVLQESLTNVHRHSGSQVARVRLSVKKEMCVLEVEDDGRGVPADVLEQSAHDWTGAPGVGVRGMNERLRQLGGSLELFSSGTGTTVCAMVPTRESSSAG
jgi:PAS domain S-box-containing protein